MERAQVVLVAPERRQRHERALFLTRAEQGHQPLRDETVDRAVSRNRTPRTSWRRRDSAPNSEPSGRGIGWLSSAITVMTGNGARTWYCTDRDPVAGRLTDAQARPSG
ncbi:hypothetical protein [Actinomadura madurae]|uniref:hypothetical protein n=1 Tax=Actinomadura madurae TaxID=1993 RepID=UPI0011BF0769|nr:hypothetical protein [Actinomadura madurae]